MYIRCSISTTFVVIGQHRFDLRPKNTQTLLPDEVVSVLVGEAFNRLDPKAQKVMEALAIYRYPIAAAASYCVLKSKLGPEMSDMILPMTTVEHH
jgi:hypothetical protein